VIADPSQQLQPFFLDDLFGSGLGGVDQAGRGSHRLAIETGHLESDDQACPGECVWVARASQLGAEQLDRPFSLADHHVRSH
jgi:hypothetical protein